MMTDGSLSILIADGSPRCREAVRETLEPQGYGIVDAPSGRDAVRIVRRERIHVVVIDVCLPDYSGPEIYHAIKETVGSALPCIFTAMDMTAGSIRDALTEDAVTILPKPVEARRLVHAIDWSVERYYPHGSRTLRPDAQRFRLQ